jgi:hypothetical protein
MSESSTLNLHTDVAALKADMRTMKDDVVEIKTDVRAMRDAQTKDRVDLAKYGLLVNGAFWAIGVVLLVLAQRFLG